MKPYGPFIFSYIIYHISCIIFFATTEAESRACVGLALDLRWACIGLALGPWGFALGL